VEKLRPRHHRRGCYAAGESRRTKLRGRRQDHLPGRRKSADQGEAGHPCSAGVVGASVAAGDLRSTQGNWLVYWIQPLSGRGGHSQPLRYRISYARIRTCRPFAERAVEGRERASRAAHRDSFGHVNAQQIREVDSPVASPAKNRLGDLSICVQLADVCQNVWELFRFPGSPMSSEVSYRAFRPKQPRCARPSV